MSNPNEFDPYAMPPEAIEEPPVSLGKALLKIGPGIILAGTIVGSGELLLTTSMGAKYGFVFLWLLLLSCVLKVFVQIELGRYAISSGKPTLGALNELPGPRLGAHWTVWWWLCMMLLTLFQHGAMTGTVAQSLNIAFPSVSPRIALAVKGISLELADAIMGRLEYPWAFLTCAIAVALLWSGNYKRIERVTTALVVGITLLTMAATVALPATDFPIPWRDVGRGLLFEIPDVGIMVAVSVFGITGVGASELFYYPYWCLEKGYARYVGQRQPNDAWVNRANGWMRVMHLDAWVSMVVFTISTLAFYFMGATVLHPQGLAPEGKDMIGTLSHMFVDTFGPWTEIVFLVGAGAVLFKTLYLSCAGNARLTADFLSLARITRYPTSEDRARVILRFSVFYPVLALVLFLSFKEPRWMVVVGGFAQALTLPMITACTIFFRYRRTDQRIKPTTIFDVLLWIAFVVIVLVAVYAVRDQVMKLVPKKPVPVEKAA